MKVEREVHIEAPPEAVYDLIADAERLGDWVTIHQWVKGDTRDELQRGDELQQCLKLAGQKFKVRWRVVESERPRRLVWEGRGPMRSRAQVVNELAAVDGGTTFSYSNEYTLPGGPLGKMAGPAVRRITGGELEKSLGRLKALLE